VLPSTSGDQEDSPADRAWQDDAPIGDIWRDDAASSQPWEEHGHRWPFESTDTIVDNGQDDGPYSSQLPSPDAGQPRHTIDSPDPCEPKLPPVTSASAQPTRALDARTPEATAPDWDWDSALDVQDIVFSETLEDVARVEQTDVYSVLLSSRPRADDLQRLSQNLTASPAFRDEPLPSLKWLFSQLAAR
jgi:hypothetical protein